jgi:hypothetical protein
VRPPHFGRLAGYEGVNDADYLAVDPVMRQIVGGRAVDHQAASASRMGRFETEVLATPKNLATLADMSGRWIDRHHAAKPLKWITLDMDSSVSPTHGVQEGTAWNGHDCSCYHPLFVFNQFGHLECCKLRPGNVHSADGWEEVLKPVMDRYADKDILRLFRADAAFAIPALYETLQAAGYLYAIRLPKNAVVQERIADLLKRPVGRPPNHVRRVYGDFEHQAGSGDKPRRVLAKVEWHPGELLPRVGFLVTNLPLDPEEVFAFYNQRGAAEQHIEEGKVDPAVVSHDGAERGPLAAPCPCLQPRHVPAGRRAARRGRLLVPDQPADAAHQDRRPRHKARPRDHLPVRRGRDPA